MKEGEEERRGWGEGRGEREEEGHSDEEMLMKIVDLSKKYPRSDRFPLFNFSLVLEV